MTFATLAVPANYPYVLLAVSAFPWLNIYQAVTVGRARKAAGIPYPEAYADRTVAAASADAMRFNCAQRAHQNTLESVPQVIFTTLLAGLKYPIFSASMGALWVFGRILYTQGYATGDPAKRNRGFFQSIASIVLAGAATWTAIDMTCALL
ncbi:hypothetical protein BOTBODRAFT_37580 [Botryobasidium botryosum FD-172 SS1]|uniref:Glutathione S-transferase 3, mitochondrial n=1 Tax=Botryobasidium botryosum (strain FD-172 SS1) TaxID=930990 RepID=A0A067M055_BOTB1|nr:hypothetical protein BOTBODRAFT_37580 [Botryobasidium botryosum FD-172 SS1]